MYRFSTNPINIFTTFNPAQARQLWLTFKQEESGTEITRTKEDLLAALEQVYRTEDGLFCFSTAFSQEESGTFMQDFPILVQLRWSERDGHSDATNIYSFYMEDVLKEGVI
ncbi:MAG: hypothetical protein IJO54_06905 [Oscillospiraceae bacterium]|nr:hypothetical protein [Oscillospiraceae bacterium]